MSELLRPWIEAQVVELSEKAASDAASISAFEDEISFALRKQPCAQIIEIARYSPFICNLSDRTYKIAAEFTPQCCEDFRKTQGSTIASRGKCIVSILRARVVFRPPQRRNHEYGMFPDPVLRVEKVKLMSGDGGGGTLGNPKVAAKLERVQAALKIIWARISLSDAPRSSQVVGSQSSVLPQTQLQSVKPLVGDTSAFATQAPIGTETENQESSEGHSDAGGEPSVTKISASAPADQDNSELEDGSSDHSSHNNTTTAAVPVRGSGIDVDRRLLGRNPTSAETSEAASEPSMAKRQHKRASAPHQTEPQNPMETPHLTLHPGWNGRTSITTQEAILPLDQRKVLKEDPWYDSKKQKKKPKFVSGYDKIPKVQPAPKVHSPRKPRTPPPGPPPKEPSPPRSATPLQKEPSAEPELPAASFSPTPPTPAADQSVAFATQAIQSVPPPTDKPSSSPPPKQGPSFAIVIESQPRESLSQYEPSQALPEDDDSDAPFSGWESESSMKLRSSQMSKAEKKKRTQRVARKEVKLTKQTRRRESSSSVESDPSSARLPSEEPPFTVTNPYGPTDADRYGILGAQQVGQWKLKKRRGEYGAEEGVVLSDYDMEEVEEVIVAQSSLENELVSVSEETQDTQETTEDSNEQTVESPAKLANAPMKPVEASKISPRRQEPVEEESDEDDIPMAPLVPYKSKASIKDASAPASPKAPVEEPAPKQKATTVPASVAVKMRTFAIVEDEPSSMSRLQTRPATEPVIAPSTAPLARPHVQVKRTPYNRSYPIRPGPQTEDEVLENIPQTNEQLSSSFEDAQVVEPLVGVSFQESTSTIRDTHSQIDGSGEQLVQKSPTEKLDKGKNPREKTPEMKIKIEPEATPFPFIWTSSPEVTRKTPRSKKSKKARPPNSATPKEKLKPKHPVKRVKKTAEFLSQDIRDSNKDYGPEIERQQREFLEQKYPANQDTSRRSSINPPSPAGPTREASKDRQAPTKQPSPERTRWSGSLARHSLPTALAAYASQAKRPLSPGADSREASMKRSRTTQNSPQAKRPAALNTTQAQSFSPLIRSPVSRWSHHEHSLPSSPPFSSGPIRYGGLRLRHLKVPGYEKLTLGQQSELEKRRKEFFGTTNMVGRFVPRYLSDLDGKKAEKRREEDVFIKKEWEEQTGDEAWWKDGDTPLRRFATQYAKIKAVKKCKEVAGVE